MADRKVNYELRGTDNTGSAFESLKQKLTQGQSQFDQLTQRLKDQTGTVGGLFSSVGKFATAVVTALGLVTFSNFIQDVASSRAHLKDLNSMGLGTVETLSQIQRAAKVMGQDFAGVVEPALQKMIKGLTSSDEETGAAGEAYRRLGIETKDLNGQWRTAGDLTQELAKKLAQYEDGTTKAAYAQAIYGRAGAAMLPVLRDMAELGDVAAKVTTRQANEAHAFEVVVKRLQATLDGSAKKMVGDLIPAATAVLTVTTKLIAGVIGVTTAADNLARANAIEDWAMTGVRAFAFVINAGDIISRQLETIGVTLGAVSLAHESLGRIAAATFKAMDNKPWDLTADVLKKFETLGETIAKEEKFLKANTAEWKQQVAAIQSAELAGDKYLKQIEKELAARKKAAELAEIYGGGQGGKVLASVSFKIPSATKAELTDAEKAFNSLVEAMKSAETEGAKLRAQASNFDQYGNSVRGTSEAVALFEIQSGKFKEVIGEEGEALKRRYVEQARANDIDQSRVQSLSGLKSALEASSRAQNEAAARELTSYRDLTVSFAESIAEQQAEIDMLGRTREEVALLTATRRIDMAVKRALEALPQEDGINADAMNRIIEAGDAAKVRILALVSTNERLKTSFDTIVDVVRDLDSAGRNFFEELISGGLKSIDIAKRLGDALKKWIADLLWQLTARPFLVQIAASITGTSVAGLSQAAGFANGGNTLSSLASGSSMFAGPAAMLGQFGTAFGNTVSLFGEFATNFASAAEFLSTGSFASALGTLGPYALAIVAAVKLFEAFKDKGENWKARLGYGDNANAYAVNGVFGRVGFQSIAGDDTLNREIQKFFESFRGFDERILATLSSAQETAVRAAVANLTSAREFAFPKGDDTAGQQLTMQFVQEYYGALFASLGPDYEKFAGVIANWKGKIEDLIAAIGEMIGVMEVVSSGTIKGLTIPILEEWQRTNETLAQTTQRVLTNWATFIDKFGDDGTKFGLITKPFTTAMEAVGVTLPATRQSFFQYVESLKLGDETQRKIYDTIMNNVGAADAYYSALERTAQAQLQASQTVSQALEHLMTPSERLAQASALLATHNISSRESLISYIHSLDDSTESGRSAIAMLGDLLKAFDLVSDANPDLHGLDAFMNRSHQIAGESVKAADRLDLVNDALANLAAAADTFQPYIDEAKSHQQGIASRYGSDTSVASAQANIASLQAQFAGLGMTVPTTTQMIAEMAAGLDPTTVRGMALLRMLDSLGLSMDVVAAATERANQAEAAARGTMGNALEAMMTDAERLANAQALVGGRTREEIESYIRSLDPTTEAGRLAIDALGALTSAFALTEQAAISAAQRERDLAQARADAALTAAQQIDAALTSLITPEQQRAADLQLLSTLGISNLDGLTAYIRSIDESTVAGQSAAAGLQALIAAFQRVHDAAVRQADDQHASIAAGAAERAKYVADVQAIWSSLTSGAERLAASTSLLTSRGMGSDTSATQLQDWVTRSGSAGMSIVDIQAVVDAWHQVTDAAQQAAEAAAQAAADRVRGIASVFDSLMTAPEKLSVASNLLAQYGIRAGATLEDVRIAIQDLANDPAGTVEEMQAIAAAWGTVSDAARTAVQAAMSAAEDALARADRIASFRGGLSDLIANTQRGRPGYDYGGYLTGKVNTARGAMAGALDPTERLDAAGKLRDALQSRYQFELDALKEVQGAQKSALEAQRQGAQAAMENLRQMAEAYQRIGDYAKGLLVGELSTLSPEAKLEEARRQYESADLDKLTGASDTYLKLAREYYGSGQGFADIFESVHSRLAGIGAQADPMLAAAKAQEAALGSIDSAIANLDTTWSPAMLSLTDQFVSELEGLSDQMLEDEATARAEADLRAREAVRLAGEQRDLLQTSNTHLAQLVTQQRIQMDGLATLLQAANAQLAALNQARNAQQLATDIRQAAL